MRGLADKGSGIWDRDSGIGNQESVPESRFPTSNSRLLISALLWLATAALVAALAMRFAMRVVGVRDDLPFPELIYSFTAPLVEPFYRFFPLGDARFDYRVFEVASLAAAGVVIIFALVVYVVGLLVEGLIRR